MINGSIPTTSLALVLTLCLSFPAALAQIQVPEKPLTNSQVIDDESALLEITIPGSALGTPERKLKARGCLVQEAQVLQCSKDFDVSFPKN